MDVDLQLFKNIMAESRHNSDLLDSFSPNQFLSKEKIIKLIRDQLILRTDSEIVIFGGWYGSILIPAFKEVKRITLIDKDKDVISIAKNRLFNHYKNVDFTSLTGETIKSDKFTHNNMVPWFGSKVRQPLQTNKVTENILTPHIHMAVSKLYPFWKIQKKASQVPPRQFGNLLQQNF